jgi:HK97 family phage major capsid protein
MIDVEALKRSRQAKIDEMNTILAGAEKRDGKALTDEERSKRTELMTEARNIGEDITAAEFSNEEEARNLKKEPFKVGDPEEFRNFGEFINAVRSGDQTLLESRAMSMGDGEKGGFLVPEKFDTQIRALMPEAGVVRPNAMVIPAGETPDAAFNLVSLDQTGTKGVYGGVKTAWTGECGLISNAGDPEFKQIKVEPQNISAYIDVSNKLLNNTTAFAEYIKQLLAGTMSGAEEDAFYNGDGVSKPLGVLNSAAAIKVKRKTAATISYDDIVKMHSVVKGTSFKWIINRVALQSLQTMVAPNTNNLVWQPGAIEGAPATIFGIPVEYNPFSPVLGAVGDIALVDLSHYVIKDGTGLAIFIDPYTQMGNNKTRIYASWNVDGQSLLTGPMLAQDGTTKVSPFVILK